MPPSSARRRKIAPPPSPRPWDCMVLAVDAATRSGWSIWYRGAYRDSGEARVDDLAAMRDVVQRTLATSLPAVLVLERPFGQKRGRAYGGAGKGRDVWRAVWADEGGVKRRIVQEYPSAWRKWVLPKGMASARREVVRPVEGQVALSLVCDAVLGDGGSGRFIGKDEAPAICLGKWATCAGKVGAVLPASKRRTV